LNDKNGSERQERNRFNDNNGSDSQGKNYSTEDERRLLALRRK
jgi:hypothetical protein